MPYLLSFFIGGIAGFFLNRHKKCEDLSDAYDRGYDEGYDDGHYDATGGWEY